MCIKSKQEFSDFDQDQTIESTTKFGNPFENGCKPCCVLHGRKYNFRKLLILVLFTWGGHGILKTVIAPVGFTCHHPTLEEVISVLSCHPPPVEADGM